jgi:CheY-like chemotaxis protein
VKNVLIIDDEAIFQDLLCHIVRRGGYHPYAVSDAQSALIAIEHGLPDVIILDDMMPTMSGSDLCVLLKSNPLTRSIPVIIYTAGVGFFMIDGLTRTGADVALQKNGKPGELLAALHHVLASVN